jgi:hypothetical protein
MAFYKTASAPILGVYQSSGKFTKVASQNSDIDKEEDHAIQQMINILSKDVLQAVARVYDISSDINDFVFPVPRAVTSDCPNNNGDNFQHDELIRFSPQHKCMVFQTFRNDPLHVEHAADNPKTARGYLPDAHYVTADQQDKHVLTVVAVDTKKDPPLAEGILRGDINSFSMGCICESVRCSACNKVAYSDKDLCDHLRWYKLSTLNGKLVYEDCLGVEYQELSVVGNPADPKAKTQALLKYAARKAAANEIKASFNVVSNLISSEDQLEVARFFKENTGRLPEAMLRLADKLF